MDSAVDDGRTRLLVCKYGFARAALDNFPLFLIHGSSAHPASLPGLPTLSRVSSRTTGTWTGLRRTPLFRPWRWTCSPLQYATRWHFARSRWITTAYVHSSAVSGIPQRTNHSSRSSSSSSADNKRRPACQPSAPGGMPGSRRVAGDPRHLPRFASGNFIACVPNPPCSMPEAVPPSPVA